MRDIQQKTDLVYYKLIQSLLNLCRLPEDDEDALKHVRVLTICIHSNEIHSVVALTVY